MLRHLILNGITILYLSYSAFCQFPPPPGQPGSTAIHKDSAVIINWAKSCSVSVGYVNIVDTTIEDAGSNKANFGKPVDGTGTADDHLVSLGDGGIAVLGFDPPIANGNGFDFAVFENGLNDTFLELAFVEVSSDGSRFVRFPATSLTPEYPQIGTFGELDATKINNLAGKYRVFFGTPFDLEELKDSSAIDIMHVTHVKLIDVIGCMKPGYETYDAFRHKVNDPWPTNFYTCGFDLDAIGVIHESTQSLQETKHSAIRISPNPCTSWIRIEMPDAFKARISIADLSGKIILSESIVGKTKITIQGLQPGIYFGRILLGDGTVLIRKIVRQ